MAKKKMKKTATRRKIKKVKRVTVAIPKDLKPRIVKKMRTKDKTKRILVVRRDRGDGFNVQVLSKGIATIVRDFEIPQTTMSELPAPVWLKVQRELAIWFARQLRKGTMPDVHEEGGRRKKLMKTALREWNAHLATKRVVQALHGTGPKPLVKTKLQMLMPFICFYNPLSRKNQPVFHIHTAYCSRLDQVRKRIHKKGGTSWVIEATGPAQAVAAQVAEFNEEDKGYVASDFEIHDKNGGCVGRPKLVTSKTTMGRIMKQKRGGRK